MKVRVTVSLKDGVLDPQGKAISHALHVLEFPEVREVRTGKVIELDLEETDPGRAEQRARQMAENLLANQVIEDFVVEILK
ncbi:phosphoribosylformylglycinamidine synthase subunit PurS [Acetobacter oeni]|uniref:Phosphoribosylformylglycinamidine synthase subunit PurS n=1 Tax=Acetobacter oeni TaxID=304077 RepID=A0A511XJH0_9PROT|nr:phosphoribosylformylglycinamidine synthase subunit PurS [Acetobacter oeni]MBB3883314.1 phosphoribosylformylglycinamidine synthase [Acetobacter oeni]NHO19518.1 phosphoribosylformylglycinamidine synthase subunit PurS [Acetobacter oeni]GBR00866.1 phosphoribosyl formylglycinamidine synthase [Acetobacter oeni LMG 21952]GEN63096.1 phosphoribosylformylglycinamidine synthase subunit PurS [Acetobacter oeni]